jgi:hypothetical protein
MAARIDRAGNVYQLDRPAGPDETVSEEDVQDPGKLARLLVRILKDVAAIKRRFFPRRLDFEDRAVTAGDSLRLPHSFNARVRWWVVDWLPDSTGDAGTFEVDAASSDLFTLVLTAHNTGTATIRVEVA